LAIAEQGMTTTTKSPGAVHLNPLLKVEKDNRQLFARLWGSLGFVSDPYQWE
jgi:hypothetical protein